ncbi:Sugar lactone lactonase YvrE [Thermomonospora echinospora]|uniref:Sugar lactone lactonase YvrE n=1 Tax=Thermomonospora echinospora TaxID=1992 RepID=A0A1H6E6D9_9ACTN|nr:SMP-30/gluconolactonase/LRE family protein [Thermomonospora echinospora]SEG92749.1 Sugar lactone lactonase YvrE [Thermomonospora echinospora]
MFEATAERIATGFSWTECPRWHEGRLVFSDMYNRRILSLPPEGGTLETLVDLSERTGLDGADIVTVGTGFLPDGRLLVNSMFEKVVLVVDGGEVSVYADLRELAVGPINDMVVDAAGRAYVTQLGFNLWAQETPAPSPIIIVEPDGSPRIATEGGELMGANGIAISADGSTLVTAEAFANKITAFDLNADGSLSGRRTFAELDELPDGLCLDADGAVWVAQPPAFRALRIVEGGEVTEQVTVPAAEAGSSTACGLGGPDRKTLYLCCGFEVFDWEASRKGAQGSIWAAQVEVSGGTTRP